MNEIEIYTSSQNNVELKVSFDNDTVWLTQAQMALLFGKARTTITEHFQNTFKEDELEEKVVCQDFRHTSQHGAKLVLNLINNKN